MTFDWGSAISSALPALIQVAGGLFANSANKADEDAKLAEQKRQFDETLALQKLKLGQGGGAQGPDRAWQRAQLLNSQASQSSEDYAMKIAAMSKLGDSIAQAYLSGSRR